MSRSADSKWRVKRCDAISGEARTRSRKGAQKTQRPRNLGLLMFLGLVITWVLGGIWLFALAVYLFR
jgi:hypothetical protein